MAIDQESTGQSTTPDQAGVNPKATAVPKKRGKYAQSGKVAARKAFAKLTPKQTIVKTAVPAK